MNYKPIIIVAGEPNSIFSEIFFKSKFNKIKNPIILIASEKLFIKQMQKLNFNYKINLIDYKKNELTGLKNNKINLINVDFKFKKTFDKISSKSRYYIENCFNLGLKILKTKDCLGLINGPISKKNF